MYAINIRRKSCDNKTVPVVLDHHRISTMFKPRKCCSFVDFIRFHTGIRFRTVSEITTRKRNNRINVSETRFTGQTICNVFNTIKVAKDGPLTKMTKRLCSGKIHNTFIAPIWHRNLSHYCFKNWFSFFFVFVNPPIKY